MTRMDSARSVEMDATDLTGRVIGAAIEVHRELGPGLLESVYAKCLFHELTDRGIECSAEVPLRVNYKGSPIDCGYRIDLVIEQQLILELKSVDALQAVHQAQLLTYMRLANIPMGLLINFNSVLLKDGIKRFRI
jgi:GxxExxY protein